MPEEPYWETSVSPYVWALAASVASQTSAAVPTSLRAALWRSRAFCASEDKEELDEDEVDVAAAAEAEVEGVAEGVEAAAEVYWPQKSQL